MADITLTAEPRELVGKGVRKLREEGKVPAVAYGHGQKTVTLSLNSRELERVYAQIGSSKLVGLKVGEGRPKNALIHEVHLSGTTGAILHADFYLVRMDEELTTEVPLHFTGETPLVFQQDGSLLRNIELVEVECLPANLPETIEVDISALDEFDKAITLADLKLPKGVKLTADDLDQVVVKVEPPRSDEELAELDAPIDEAAELPEGVKEEDPAAIVAEENEGKADR